MRYIWDSAKDALNRRKHLLSLADGISVLEDPDRESWIDSRFDYGEERILTLGRNSSRFYWWYQWSLRRWKMKNKRSASSRLERQHRMRLAGTTSVTHEPGQSPMETSTDWAAVEALTSEQVETAARSDPDAQPMPSGDENELAGQGLTRLVNVKKLREQVGLTQEAFASTYRIPVGTLRDWEQSRKFPDAPARAYLTIIARDPQGIAALLGEAA